MFQMKQKCSEQEIEFDHMDFWGANILFYQLRRTDCDVVCVGKNSFLCFSFTKKGFFPFLYFALTKNTLKVLEIFFDESWKFIPFCSKKIFFMQDETFCYGLLFSFLQ